MKEITKVENLRYKHTIIIALQALVVGVASSLAISIHPDSQNFKNAIEIISSGSLIISTAGVIYYGFKNLQYSEQENQTGEFFSKDRRIAFTNFLICVASLVPNIANIQYILPK